MRREKGEGIVRAKHTCTCMLFYCMHTRIEGPVRKRESEERVRVTEHPLRREKGEKMLWNSVKRE